MLPKSPHWYKFHPVLYISTYLHGTCSNVMDQRPLPFPSVWLKEECRHSDKHVNTKYDHIRPVDSGLKWNHRIRVPTNRKQNEKSFFFFFLPCYEKITKLTIEMVSVVRLLFFYNKRNQTENTIFNIFVQGHEMLGWKWCFLATWFLIDFRLPSGDSTDVCCFPFSCSSLSC